MGMRETEPQMADAFGIPEFFITTVGRIECAGGGCVRSYGCSQRGGILVPQYMVIMPILSMIETSNYVRDQTQMLYTKELSALHVH